MSVEMRCFVSGSSNISGISGQVKVKINREEAARQFAEENLLGNNGRLSRYRSSPSSI